MLHFQPAIFTGNGTKILVYMVAFLKLHIFYKIIWGASFETKYSSKIMRSQVYFLWDLVIVSACTHKPLYPGAVVIIQ